MHQLQRKSFVDADSKHILCDLESKRILTRGGMRGPLRMIFVWATTGEVQMSKSNEQTLTLAYKSWILCRGMSVACWVAIIAFDFAYSSNARNNHGLSFAVPHRGVEGLMCFHCALMGQWEMLAMDIVATRTYGNERVLIVTQSQWRNRKTGTIAMTKTFALWRFVDGKAVSVYERLQKDAFIAAMAA